RQDRRRLPVYRSRARRRAGEAEGIGTARHGRRPTLPRLFTTPQFVLYRASRDLWVPTEGAGQTMTRRGFFTLLAGVALAHRHPEFPEFTDGTNCARFNRQALVQLHGTEHVITRDEWVRLWGEIQ